MSTKDNFLNAIEEKRLVSLTFDSRSKGIITRTCVPLDFGPWNRTSSNEDRYHFIDLDSSAGQHNLSILPEQIIAMEVLEEKFKPENIVHWVPEWHVARDWGLYS